MEKRRKRRNSRDREFLEGRRGSWRERRRGGRETHQRVIQL